MYAKFVGLRFRFFQKKFLHFIILLIVALYYMSYRSLLFLKIGNYVVKCHKIFIIIKGKKQQKWNLIILWLKNPESFASLLSLAFNIDSYINLSVLLSEEWRFTSRYHKSWEYFITCMHYKCTCATYVLFKILTSVTYIYM